MWTFVRSSTWWDDVMLNSFDPCDWKNDFHIGKQTFDYLCHKLQPLIEKQNTNMSRPVSVERYVAISLWILATPSEDCMVSHLFCLIRCTVCVIVHETCRAIIQSLQSVYISFLIDESLTTVIEVFQSRCNIPRCAGAVDGTHIPIFDYVILECNNVLFDSNDPTPIHVHAHTQITMWVCKFLFTHIHNHYL